MSNAPELPDRYCRQCDGRFTPIAGTQFYCTRECRWDHSNGRAREISIARRTTGFGWPVVQPAAPAVLANPVPKHLGMIGFWKTAAILPDIQFGFRWLDSGALAPFHDDAALSIAEQVVAVEEPNLAIWLGDTFDLPMFGRYRMEPGFARTLQPALDRGYQHFVTVRAYVNEARHMEGNHDARLRNFIIDNAKAAAGMRRAGASPDDWPVNSIPYLTRMDELGIEYVGAYPAGATYINDNLAAVHGVHTSSRTRSAGRMVVDEERISTIQGHDHRIWTIYRTRNVRGGARYNLAHSPGTLAGIDGRVPSVKSGVTDRGVPIKTYEDWQQGLTIVRYEEGDGRFSLESIPIFDGWAVHRGKEFTA